VLVCTALPKPAICAALIAKLADKHTVIAPDFAPFLASHLRPKTATPRKAMGAGDIHALGKASNYDRIPLVGHDIGLMVLTAYVPRKYLRVTRVLCGGRSCPASRLESTCSAAPISGTSISSGKTPLALVTAAERIYLEHFLERFCRRSREIRVRGRPQILPNDMPGRSHEGRHGSFPARSERRGGFCRSGQNQLSMPDAGAVG